MIRATGKMKDGRPFLLLGMDRENITRLTAGKPIVVRMESVGIERDVLICFGETLQALTDELIEAGFVLPSEGVPQ
jgi:hypothetical protein